MPHEGLRVFRTSAGSVACRHDRFRRSAKLSSVAGLCRKTPFSGMNRETCEGLLADLKNWLGGRDLNPDTVVQSHVSYRWTTSQCS